MKRIRVIQGLAIGALLPMLSRFSAQAADPPAIGNSSAIFSALKQGGYVIVFRHGATNRNQADTDPLNPSNISKQRLLSSQGKQQAQQIGAAWKKLGIPLGKTYTSKFQRAIETGQLISGQSVISSIDLTEGGLVVTPIENERRAKSLVKMATMPPATGMNTLIVTHKPNIIDAFGKDWFEVKEGEASIFKPDATGKLALFARLKAPEWLAAAQ
jgi:phosphohistidine phosphatase SixA